LHNYINWSSSITEIQYIWNIATYLWILSNFLILIFIGNINWSLKFYVKDSITNIKWYDTQLCSDSSFEFNTLCHIMHDSILFLSPWFFTVTCTRGIIVVSIFISAVLLMVLICVRACLHFPFMLIKLITMDPLTNIWLLYPPNGQTYNVLKNSMIHD
jgi:hypothetical protein